jgi:hypothetical protein
MFFLVTGFIRDSFSKLFNPDAVKADLGDGMQAYYDADRKVWVFPGDDPAELAKPIGPPPITPVATNTSAATPVVTTTPNNDPLAAMMLPPTRIPSAKRTRLPQGKSEGKVAPPVATFSPPPNFAVFAAKPAVKSDGDTAEF